MSEKTFDWRLCAARMRGDLDRADLTGRARRLAEFSIKATLIAGRTRVVIPNRMALCELLDIGKNHVAEVVAALASARIVRVTAAADGWELLVYPDSAGWDVDWIYTREELQRFLQLIAAAPGQCQGELLEPAPDLARTMAEVSAANAKLEVQNSKPEGAGSQNGNPRRAEPLPAVPKMGTPRAPLKSFQVSKPYKAYSFETLKDAVSALDGGDEGRAMDACRRILTDAVMLNDGGKWRNRWRANRGKVKRVFAAAVEDMAAHTVRSPGGHVEWLWQEFA